ncbi:MAG TPA: hypothetical protein VMU51_21035 [Mycobacteriales bacterium]|nr:hypothetical protein [Mycobacteriales bacterium]
MTGRRIAAAVTAAALVLPLPGCRSGGTAPAGTGSPSAPGPAAAPPSTGSCPVTRPSPTGPRGVSPDAFFGWGASYGNGALWVGGLWPGGVIDADPESVQADGSVSTKFGWWRATRGRLTITGQRLDAAAPGLRTDVPDGYGDTGFQATGVTFPTNGCWRITGHAGPSTLTFVTLVVRTR